jgi:hypothetical protein
MDEPAHLLDFLLFDELRRIELFDFARDLAIKQRGIERLNAGNATAADQQRLPVLLRGIADGADEADARDYDSAGNKRLSFFSLPARPEAARGDRTEGQAKRARQIASASIMVYATAATRRSLSDAGGERGDAAETCYFFLFSM